mmetsp:Transcript_35132/g.56756  ORF Transcript_35132/g.56756 Transcript_35132/m.56756 type:complete len:292 (-) Transcript_35132:8-883(-)
MTASQIASMISEMLFAVRQGAPGMDQMLKMCFNENVVVSSLSQRHQLVTGRDKVIGALVTGALIGKSKGLPQAEPIARVVAESVSSDAKDTLVSMALDVYAGGKSPFGVLASQGGGGSLIVLRARRCQIDAMWVGDCGAGAKMMCNSKESFLNSSTWPIFKLAIRLSLQQPLLPLGETGETVARSVVTCILNNYSKTVDTAGLGIGSETTSETWTEELTAENEAAIKAAEVQRKQAQLLKSLAALEKVTPHLHNDKKIAKAAPIFLNMLKSEAREDTCDAVLTAAKAAQGG